MNPAHVYAISFLILIGFLWYKNFFGIFEVLDHEIFKIKEEIDESQAKLQQALDHLEAVKIKYNSLEAEIKKIQDHSEHTIQQLQKHQTVELTLVRENLIKKHHVNLVYLEKRLNEKYQQAFVDKLMMSVQSNFEKKIQNDQMTDSYLALLETDSQFLSNQLLRT